MARIKLRAIRFKPLEIPFKVAFRHASAERTETLSMWVEAVSESGLVGYGESCPRPYVTNETLDSARVFVERHEAVLRSSIVDLASIHAWMAAHGRDIDANPAAWCAIELALLDLLAKEAGQTVEALLSQPALTGPFRYSAVLGDAEGKAFRAIATQYVRMGFTDFKVKLSGQTERDREKLVVLEGLGRDFRIRADANNLWNGPDEAIRALEALGYRFFALEEPIRANQHAALAWVGEALGCRIVLDESFLRLDQLATIDETPGRWIINVRVSKMGGLIRSLRIVEAARAGGVGLIVGAQVGETSLLTRAALTVASAAAEALVAQEGAFGTFLLERDVCDPSLMFGQGGVLDIAKYPALRGPGFGLAL